MNNVSNGVIFHEVFSKLQDCITKLKPVSDTQLQTSLDQIEAELCSLRKYPLGFLDESYIEQVKNASIDLTTALLGLQEEIRYDASDAQVVRTNVKRALDKFTSRCLEIKDVLQIPFEGKRKMKWFFVSLGAFILASILFFFTKPSQETWGKALDTFWQMSLCGKGTCVFIIVAIMPWLFYFSRSIWRYVSAAIGIVWGWRWKICVPLSWKCKEYHATDEDMENNDMIRMLRLYFESSNTDYALMINGEWGSGKTYYVHHSINCLLRQCNKKLLYVSLNGIRSFDEVAAQIVFSTRWPYMGKIAHSFILPFAAKWLPEKTISFICSQLKSVAEKKSRSPKFHGEYDLTPSDYVIFVDDIERATNKEDDKGGPLLMDILGRIFDEFISKGYHVVFIGTEVEMDGESRFFKEKEKYIRHTIDFVPDIPMVIDSIVASYYGIARRHAQLAADFITRFAVTYNVKNIRTIKRILEGFILLAEKVNDEALLSKSADKMMEIFAPTIVERISGVFCGKSIDQILVQTKANSSADDSEGQAWCKSLAALYDRLYPQDVESKSATSVQTAQHKEDPFDYMSSHYKISSCPCKWVKDSSIVYFAITGLIDDNSFRREIQSWVPPAENIYAKALDSVWQFESIEDVDFMTNYPIVINGLTSGQYNAEQVNLACALLVHFTKNGWISIDCGSMIQNAVQSLKERWVKEPDDYINPMILHNRQEDFLQPIVNAIQEETTFREKKSAEEDVSKFLAALSKKDKETAWTFLPQNQQWEIFNKIVKVGKTKEFCNIPNWALTLISVNLKEGDVFIPTNSSSAIEQIVEELDNAIKACDLKRTPLRKDRLNELKSKFSEILNSPKFKPATKLEVAQEHKPETQAVAEVIPATNNEQRKA